MTVITICLGGPLHKQALPLEHEGKHCLPAQFDYPWTRPVATAGAIVQQLLITRYIMMPLKLNGVDVAAVYFARGTPSELAEAMLYKFCCTYLPAIPSMMGDVEAIFREKVR